MSSTHPNARCVDSLSYEVPNNIPYLLLAFSQGNNSRRRPLKRPPLRLLLAINTHTHTHKFVGLPNKYSTLIVLK
jgi:hypothetical protein